MPEERDGLEMARLEELRLRSAGLSASAPPHAIDSSRGGLGEEM